MTGRTGRRSGSSTPMEEPVDVGAIEEGVSCGSGGRSAGGSSVFVYLSECSPTGLRGSRKVPLLEFGSIPSESQMML